MPEFIKAKERSISRKMSYKKSIVFISAWPNDYSPRIAWVDITLKNNRIAFTDKKLCRLQFQSIPEILFKFRPIQAKPP
jgi:hypothetical protein